MVGRGRTEKEGDEVERLGDRTAAKAGAATSSSLALGRWISWNGRFGAACTPILI